MNKKLFIYWPINILITIPVILMLMINGVLLLIIGTYFGSVSVISQLYTRYEQWVYNVPKGYFVNCAYSETLKQTFVDEFKSVTEGQYYVKNDR